MSESVQTAPGVIDDSFVHVFMTLGDLGYEVNIEDVEAILRLSEDDPTTDIDRLTKSYARANKLPKRATALKPR
jgi:hypothetical protein